MYTSYIKKFACIFTFCALCNLCSTHAMMDKINIEPINLQLAKRPNTTSVYNWCCQRAKKFVEEKKQKIMSMLNVTKEIFYEKKDYVRNFYFEETNLVQENIEKNTFPLSDKAKQAVLNILKHPSAIKTLGIKKIITRKNIIIAERKSGTLIAFVQSTKKNYNIEACGYNVYLPSEDAIQNKYSLTKLEGSIGHELGHIAGEHSIDVSTLKLIFNGKKYNRTSQEAFTLAMNEFIRAQETEADIIGIFDNAIWLKIQKQLFIQNIPYTGEPMSYLELDKLGISQDPLHPSTRQRAFYLLQILRAIEQDVQSKINKQKFTSFITAQANPQPKQTTDKKSSISYSLAPKTTPRPSRPYSFVPKKMKKVENLETKPNTTQANKKSSTSCSFIPKTTPRPSRPYSFIPKKNKN